MPPPFDDALASELSKIETKLSAMYGSGKYCYSENDCNDLEGFESIIDNSRDPDQLKRAYEQELLGFAPRNEICVVDLVRHYVQK